MATASAENLVHHCFLGSLRRKNFTTLNSWGWSAYILCRHVCHSNMNRPLGAPINEIPTRPRAQCSLPAPVLLADAVLALTTGLWHFDVCICVIPTHWSQVGQPLFACDFNFWQNTMKYQNVQQGSTHQLCGFELLTVYQYRFGMVARNQSVFSKKSGATIFVNFPEICGTCRCSYWASALGTSPLAWNHVFLGSGVCPWVYHQNCSSSWWKWHAVDFEVLYFQTNPSEGRNG